MAGQLNQEMLTMRNERQKAAFDVEGLTVFLMGGPKPYALRVRLEILPMHLNEYMN